MQVMTCLEGYTQYHISKGPSNGSRKIKNQKMEIVFILIRKIIYTKYYWFEATKLDCPWIVDTWNLNIFSVLPCC